MFRAPNFPRLERALDDFFGPLVSHEVTRAEQSDAGPVASVQQDIRDTRLVWQSAPTARGASLDELLQANIVVSAAHVQGQLPDLAATPTPVSAPGVTPAV